MTQEVNSNRNQSLALQATGSRGWKRFHRDRQERGLRARCQWGALCTLCDRNEAMAGAGVVWAANKTRVGGGMGGKSTG